MADGDQLREGADILNSAASDMLRRIQRVSARRKYRRSDFELRRAAFAAFEAHRDDPRSHKKLPDAIFYTLFLASTFLSPAFVVFLPDAERTIAWETFGVASTVLLLLYTYGSYTVEMAYDMFSGVIAVIVALFWVGVDPTEVTESEDSGNAPQKYAHFAVTNLALLTVGLLVSYWAWTNIHQLYEFTIKGAVDTAAYNGAYIWFFVWIFILSGLLIIMDLHVAVTERSHSETFVASSSATYATIPMFIGILIMGFYLGMEYLHARFFAGNSPSEAMKQLPVDFVSGALSFQMIMSNVLFILIKLNLLLRLAYLTIDTSKDV